MFSHPLGFSLEFYDMMMMIFLWGYGIRGVDKRLHQNGRWHMQYGWSLATRTTELNGYGDNRRGIGVQFGHFYTTVASNSIF